MAGSLKKIFIIGNLGSDPVMRYMQDGTPVATFNVAVNERARRVQNAEGAAGGQPEETTTWFRVSAWRRQAEIANDLLKKGTSVFVSGDLRTSEFTGNDGQKRFSLEVTMQDMQILTPKGVAEGGSFDDSSAGGGQAANRPSFPSGNRQGSGRPAPNIPDEDDGDIPF
jgi:single-strand DNA-binding protein